jgi:hypothetical protein
MVALDRRGRSVDKSGLLQSPLRTGQNMDMTLEQAIVEKLRSLPPQAQRDVLAFTESLHLRSANPKTPLKSLRGLWTGLGLDITSQEIADARREIWGNFPRNVEA